MFKAALLIIVKKCKQLQCPSTDEEINTTLYSPIVEYYSAIESNIDTSYSVNKLQQHTK